MTKFGSQAKPTATFCFCGFSFDECSSIGGNFTGTDSVFSMIDIPIQKLLVYSAELILISKSQVIFFLFL